jgi:hypothetical protein
MNVTFAGAGTSSTSVSPYMFTGQPSYTAGSSQISIEDPSATPGCNADPNPIGNGHGMILCINSHGTAAGIGAPFVFEKDGAPVFWCEQNGDCHFNGIDMQGGTQIYWLSGTTGRNINRAQLYAPDSYAPGQILMLGGPNVTSGAGVETLQPQGLAGVANTAGTAVLTIAGGSGTGTAGGAPLQLGTTAGIADAGNTHTITAFTITSGVATITCTGCTAGLYPVGTYLTIVGAAPSVLNNANYQVLTSVSGGVTASAISTGTWTGGGTVSFTTSTAGPVVPAVSIAGASGTTPGSVSLLGITGSTQCLQVNTSGAISGTGATCGGSSMVYPGAGIANSTGAAWGTSYTTSGSGTVLALTTSPTFTTPALGTPSALVLTNATGLVASTGTTATGTPSSTTYLRGDNTWATPSGGGGITALTGDVTASGSGSVAATVAAIQGVAVGTPTGTGNVVFSASPTLTGTPNIAAATGTTLSLSGQMTSTLATGTAPFVVASTTVVANLNASKLLGNTWAAPLSIGSTTPNTGAFTTLSATTPIAVASGGTGVGTSTGTGSVVLSTSPTLVTPALGTPSALVLTNATGLVASTGTTATGTPSSTTYLRGDNTWATPGGSGTVTSVACPSATITSSGNCNPLTTTGTSGDVITATGSANGVQDSGTLLSSLAAQWFPTAAYVSNNWYLTPFTTIGGGSAEAAGTLYCYAFPLPASATIKGLGIRTTTAGSSNTQVGIYANSGGFPNGAVLANTGNIANNGAAGTYTAAISQTTAALTPGIYWGCTNSNDGTVVMTGIAQTAGTSAWLAGSATASNVLGSAAVQTALTATVTFGTWPSMTSSGWSSIATGKVPAVIFEVN